MTKTIHLPFDANLHPLRMLKAGAFNLVYEHGNLRYIKAGTTEVIRMIYIAVRDENWFTVPYKLEDEHIEEKEGGFLISHTAMFSFKEIHYKAAVRIEAENNTVSFSMKGETLSSFKRNRIGICVLHPIVACSGKQVTIIKPDGTEYKATFPKLISPHQPFQEIVQMQWPVDNSNDIRLDFYGDIFETEDQRNWVDHSYKTYSTPAALPLPVQVTAGDNIEQKVVLTVVAKQNSKLPTQLAESLPAKFPFPKIGYCRVNGSRLNEEQIQLLHAVPFDHYRVELHLYAPGWNDELNNAIKEASTLNTRLELIVFFDDFYEIQLKNLTDVLAGAKHPVESVLILRKNHKVTPAALLKTIYPVLKGILPHVAVGYGTDGFLAELNRDLPRQLDYDFVSFGMNPQAHLNDTRTLLENLDAQQHALKTLRNYIGDDKEVHVSPITFKTRSRKPSSRDDYDERQHMNFGAAWTLLTIQNLSSAHLTFYDTLGYKGIISNDDSNLCNLSPLYKLLAEIKAFKPVWILPYQPKNPFDIILENGVAERLIFSLDAAYFESR